MGNVANVPPAASPVLPAPGRVGVTVREVLALPGLAGASVAAGAGGLARVVRRANVMEVPDVLPWVRPDELMLTTGYPLRGRSAELPGLVAALDERGLAALGVKLHRYLDELPDEMLAEADRRALPIILLPEHVGFDELLDQVLGEVLNRQAALLERLERQHRSLVSVVLDGGGLEELAREVAATVDGPVLITTTDGRVLATGGQSDEVMSDPACFDATGRFRTESAAPGLHAGAESRRPFAVVPVVAGRVDHGRIVAFAGSRPLDDGDVRLLERAATVAALAVTKQLAVSAVEGKYRGDFLRDVLTGRAGDADHVVAHCATLGWDVARPLVVVVAELDPQPGEDAAGAPGLRPAQERFADAWQTVMRRRDPAAPVVGFAREVVALLPVPPGVEVTDLVDAVAREVSGDGGGGRRPYSAGVSRVVHEVSRLPEAYEQARKAVRVSRQLHGGRAVAHFDGLGVYRLLSLIDDPAELQGFVTETLGALAADDPDTADLRRTLQVLLEHNLNVAEAARALHFHYNTLRYRIGKLERIVGPFTLDPDLRLDLAVALKVLQMRGLR